MRGSHNRPWQSDGAGVPPSRASLSSARPPTAAASSGNEGAAAASAAARPPSRTGYATLSAAPPPAAATDYEAAEAAALRNRRRSPSPRHRSRSPTKTSNAASGSLSSYERYLAQKHRVQASSSLSSSAAAAAASTMVATATPSSTAAPLTPSSVRSSRSAASGSSGSYQQQQQPKHFSSSQPAPLYPPDTPSSRVSTSSHHSSQGGGRTGSVGSGGAPPRYVPPPPMMSQPSPPPAPVKNTQPRPDRLGLSGPAPATQQQQPPAPSWQQQPYRVPSPTATHSAYPPNSYRPAAPPAGNMSAAPASAMEVKWAPPPPSSTRPPAGNMGSRPPTPTHNMTTTTTTSSNAARSSDPRRSWTPPTPPHSYDYGGGGGGHPHEMSRTGGGAADSGDGPAKRLSEHFQAGSRPLGPPRGSGSSVLSGTSGTGRPRPPMPADSMEAQATASNLHRTRRPQEEEDEYYYDEGGRPRRSSRSPSPGPAMSGPPRAPAPTSSWASSGSSAEGDSRRNSQMPPHSHHHHDGGNSRGPPQRWSVAHVERTASDSSAEESLGRMGQPPASSMHGTSAEAAAAAQRRIPPAPKNSFGQRVALQKTASFDSVGRPTSWEGRKYSPAVPEGQRGPLTSSLPPTADGRRTPNFPMTASYNNNMAMNPVPMASAEELNRYRGRSASPGPRPWRQAPSRDAADGGHPASLVGGPQRSTAYSHQGRPNEDYDPYGQVEGSGPIGRASDVASARRGDAHLARPMTPSQATTSHNSSSAPSDRSREGYDRAMYDDHGKVRSNERPGSSGDVPKKDEPLASASAGLKRRSTEQVDASSREKGVPASIELSGDANSAKLESSREMRQRRLRQEQESRGGGIGADGNAEAPLATASSTVDSSNLNKPTNHFVAHDPSVEKYLTRSHLIEGIRNRSDGQAETDTAREPPNIGRMKLDETHPGESTNDNKREYSKLEPREISSKRTGESSSVAYEAPVRSSNGMHHSNQQSSTNLAVGLSKQVSSDPSPLDGRQGEAIPDDEVQRNLDSSSRGWSTFRRSSDTSIDRSKQSTRPITPEAATTGAILGSTNSKVGQYLASRSASLPAPLPPSRIEPADGRKSTEPAVSYMGSTDEKLRRDEMVAEITSEEDSDVDMEASDGEYDNQSTDSEQDGQEWSVRVCIVSAVDLPASVVPNLPLSPVLKVGLIKLPLEDSTQAVGQPTRQGDGRLVKLASEVESKGIASIPKARVRSTSSKVLSRRDNGSVEFHEEIRWDRVKDPEQMALAIELSSRAVMTPPNFRESPPAQQIGPLQINSLQSSAGVASTSKLRTGTSEHLETSTSGIGALFRRGAGKKNSPEMETANAAAAVAKLLVEGGEPKPTESGDAVFSSADTKKASSSGNPSEINVTLRKRQRRRTKLTEDLRLGSRIVPLAQLPLKKAIDGKETVRIEQWFELEGSYELPKASETKVTSSASSKRCPSVLIEISFASLERLDDSEDDMDNDEDPGLKASFSKRASIRIRNQLKSEVIVEEKVDEPVLQPGVVDFIAVVGARDIGNQKADDGSRGWVNSTPECCILEQFPPSDEFHAQNGRTSSLPNKVEWFCFPEGVKLWRGTTPPNHDELNLKRFSASSPANIATSYPLFDAYLGCITSFVWFVIASNSDEYGSDVKKTYGAVVRFFVPAPLGVDPTQDDFAQTLIGGHGQEAGDVGERKRLWVPLGICLTTSLPIVGVLEVLLLRLCEALSDKGFSSLLGEGPVIQDIFEVILNSQRPIPGVVNCSIPFLTGERLHIALPPSRGLPPLPHGNSVASVCRLLGADGVNILLAAFLTECKILLHSDDVANISMVAEVMTSLIYPFQWSLPYIPVLPVEMMEFIEAPLSYLLGIPSANMKYIDVSALEDVVVFDLDRDLNETDDRTQTTYSGKTKTPVPLPASVASNIAKAVHRLLRAEEDAEVAFGGTTFQGSRSFPRLEPESLPEREFRITVALEIGGLLRGFDDCLVFASSQPVFNTDKFLQSAPALFEEQRGTISSKSQGPAQPVISPRSRRFLSLVVNCQHFYQFLEYLESERTAFFRDAMRRFDNTTRQDDKSLAGRLLSIDASKQVSDLCKALQKLEDKIPTYRVSKSHEKGNIQKTDETMNPNQLIESNKFPQDLLQQIVVSSSLVSGDAGASAEGVKQVSLEYLVELEKNPWRYQKLFSSVSSCRISVDKVKLRDAIGERRYHAWKTSKCQDTFDTDESSEAWEGSRARAGSASLDIATLLSSAGEEPESPYSDFPEEQNEQLRIASAKDRDVLRRCLEKSFSSSDKADLFIENGRDLIGEAELALRNSSARRFLLTVLSKRGRVEPDESRQRRPSMSSSSKLEPGSFEVLVRLGCAMLDACMETRDYSSAYALLKLSAGLFTSTGESESDTHAIYLTARLGLHPVYADTGVWELVKNEHLLSRRDAKVIEIAEVDKDTDEYEATVSTLYEMVGYGIPAEELARFASRVSELNGWFQSDRGQSLLMLSRRLCVRREIGEGGSTLAKKSDIELMSQPSSSTKTTKSEPFVARKQGFDLEQSEYSGYWIDYGWCHPAAQSTRRSGVADSVKRITEEKITSTPYRGAKYMSRAAVTSVAFVGSSVFVSGGLDGGVFLAHQTPVYEGGESETDQTETAEIRGVHLDWGSSGSRFTVGASSASTDGEYGVGSVTCLASTRGSYHSYQALSAQQKSDRKDVVGPLDDEDLLEAMEGCRVVAGTTCGDLRVWTLKDVFSAVMYSTRGPEESSSPYAKDRRTLRSDVASSGFASRKKTTDFTSGSSLTRLKFSLRGRALSGHRGGVSCIDVPSNVYRPDSVVTGGADGLIKLWSLRTPNATSSRRSDGDHVVGSFVNSSSATSDSHGSMNKATRSGDALSILSGHGGRILCVRTAWHGDRLLSGGADRTVRLWDLAGSGGKCLNSLSGHLGWVTSVHYWGPNTIISASTDRSVSLWDARVRNSPLFSLRHHYAPITDVLVGARTDPIMVSAASDGTIAAWDFRRLSTASEHQSTSPNDSTASAAGRQRCKVVRSPAAKLYMHDFSLSRHVFGPVLLSRGLGLRISADAPKSSTPGKTVLCLGRDAILREWDLRSGEILSEHVSGHCDTVSFLASFQGNRIMDSNWESSSDEAATPVGTITASWDGTVRMRAHIRQ